MRIHSFIKVCIAVLTIAFAITIGTVHVSAQNAPPMPNVTQVRMTCNPNDISDLWCWTYDRIATDRWVQRRNDGKTFQFARGNFSVRNSILLSDTSRGISVSFHFNQTKDAIVGMTFEGRHRVAFGTITGVYEVSDNNSPETCKQQTTAGVKCTCDLGSLRPLQGAVGMEEVMNKKGDIDGKNIDGKKTRLDLAYDPIKLVRGPNGLLYVTDHHHGARAWIEAGRTAGRTMGTCQIQSDTISTDPTQFWVDLKDRKLVRLADKNGNPITETQLPTTLEALPDDPYRTLAWRVRKGEKGVEGSEGFCRGLMTENKEFAEFQWADWLRKRPEFQNPPGPKGWSDKKRKEAIALAKTSAASELPGYRRNLSVLCPPDPD